MASAQIHQLQDRLQTASSEFQKIQSDLSKIVEARQKLETQQSENQLVEKEFSLLTPEQTVYKLIGPVLVKQDQVDAKSNVKKRLEFINGEMKRVEGQLKDLELKADQKKEEIMEIQAAIQHHQQPQAANPPTAITA
ncbi:prefoldin subunit beta family protein [Abortiporus biennis]